MIGERQRRIISATLLAVLAAAGAGGVVGVVGKLAPRIPNLAARVVAVAALAGAFLAMLPRWRRLDDMERDSRLRSWYWGGGFAGGVGVVLILVFVGPRGPLFVGAAIVWCCQCAGYYAARFQWWLAHRAEAA